MSGNQSHLVSQLTLFCLIHLSMASLSLVRANERALSLPRDKELEPSLPPTKERRSTTTYSTVVSNIQ
jgi:hypothetical protein